MTKSFTLKSVMFESFMDYGGGNIEKDAEYERIKDLIKDTFEASRFASGWIGNKTPDIVYYKHYDTVGFSYIKKNNDENKVYSLRIEFVHHSETQNTEMLFGLFENVYGNVKLIAESSVSQFVDSINSVSDETVEWFLLNGLVSLVGKLEKKNIVGLFLNSVSLHEVLFEAIETNEEVELLDRAAELFLDSFKSSKYSRIFELTLNQKVGPIRGFRFKNEQNTIVDINFLLSKTGNMVVRASTQIIMDTVLPKVKKYEFRSDQINELVDSLLDPESSFVNNMFDSLANKFEEIGYRHLFVPEEENPV